MIYREKHPGERCFSYLVINQKYKIMQYTEIWKDVHNLDGYYQVSNQGRVRSLTRKIKCANRSNFIMVSRILSPSVTSSGYFMLHLRRDRRQYNLQVHRMVAEAFIDNPYNKPQVNHFDGNKLNNYVSNLEWLTSSENNKHAFKVGLNKPIRGSNNVWSKLTEVDVLEIRKRYVKGVITTRALANEFGVSASVIWHIVNRNKWTHI